MHICRFHTEKGSLFQRRLKAKGGMKDAVAYDDKLFFLIKSGISWFNPRQLLVVEFENEYKHRYLDTQPDPVHLFPEGKSFGMDQWNGSMWILTTSGSAMTELKNQFWKLDLSLRQWTRLTVELPHSIVEPLVHCIPMGKCFVLGDCPEFPMSWLPIVLEDSAPSPGTHQCVTPAHLYSFWLDVPKLSRLAIESSKKHFPALDLSDPFTTKKLGIPKITFF